MTNFGNQIALTFAPETTKLPAGATSNRLRKKLSEECDSTD